MMTDSSRGRNNTYQRESSIRLDVDDLPPPETTRPTPQRVPIMSRSIPSPTTSPMSNRSRRFIGPQSTLSPASQNRSLCNPSSQRHSSGVNVWRQPVVQPISGQTQSWPLRGPVEVDRVVDLRAVMIEQEQEQEQQQEIERRNLEDEAEKEAEMIAVQAQEEEFVRLAMEMSLSESMNSSHNVLNFMEGDDTMTEISESNSIGMNDTRIRHASTTMPTVAEVDNREGRNDDLDEGQGSDSSEILEMFDKADGLRRGEDNVLLGRSESWKGGSSLRRNNLQSGTEENDADSNSEIHQPISSSAIDNGQEDEIQIDGREVVLEMARRFLDSEEVELIKDALERGMQQKSTRALQVHDEKAKRTTRTLSDAALPASNNNVEVAPVALEKDVAESSQAVHSTTLRKDEKTLHVPEFESNYNERNEENPDSSVTIQVLQSTESSNIEDEKFPDEQGSFVSAFVSAVSPSSTEVITRRDEDTLKNASASLSGSELLELKRALLVGSFKSKDNVSKPGSFAVRNDEVSSRPTVVPPQSTLLSTEFDLAGANEHLSEQELLEIQRALQEEGASDLPQNNIISLPVEMNAGISAEESAAILKALREADEMEERKSLELALQLQQEQELLVSSSAIPRNRISNQGNVRTMTRLEYEAEQQRSGLFPSKSSLRNNPYEQNQSINADEYDIDNRNRTTGFRMNSNRIDDGNWRRRDQNSVVGPNSEIRTKHDSTLDGFANVERLGLESNDFPVVGNKAYNSFLQSVKKSTKKGVESHGTGRAGSDTDATKGGAMDPRVRSQIIKAINNEFIEQCNGVVKEGKEAVVFHADKGTNSDGFDVAIKVFKRIQEFRERGDYVDGDPRYGKVAFRNNSDREQVELWAEKEFRNLIRANRAGVPVPSPLFYKENIVFMRFLGVDGWPSPQLREVELRRSSRIWETLYLQILQAVRNLYQNGRLVHGDLSEYNVLVVPGYLVENRSGVDEVSDSVDPRQDEDLQAVLIDFGQSVDVHHPNSLSLLQRDLSRILTFFARQDIETMTLEDAMSYVLSAPSVQSTAESG